MIHTIRVHQCCELGGLYFRLPVKNGGSYYYRVVKRDPIDCQGVRRVWARSYSLVVEHAVFVDRDEAARRLWALGYGPLDR